MEVSRPEHVFGTISNHNLDQMHEHTSGSRRCTVSVNHRTVGTALETCGQRRVTRGRPAALHVALSDETDSHSGESVRTMPVRARVELAVHDAHEHLLNLRAAACASSSSTEHDGAAHAFWTTAKHLPGEQGTKSRTLLRACSSDSPELHIRPGIFDCGRQ